MDIRTEEHNCHLAPRNIGAYVSRRTEEHNRWRTLRSISPLYFLGFTEEYKNFFLKNYLFCLAPQHKNFYKKYFDKKLHTVVFITHNVHNMQGSQISRKTIQTEEIGSMCLNSFRCLAIKTVRYIKIKKI
jgi:hypothetical protein